MTNDAAHGVWDFGARDADCVAWSFICSIYPRRADHTPDSAGQGFEEWFEMAQEDLKTFVKISDGPQPELLSSA